FFFLWYNGQCPPATERTTVMARERDTLSDLERALKEQFNPQNLERFVSTTPEVPSSEYVQELVQEPNTRGRMPITREDYIGAENPARVEWEKEVRIFLRNLNYHYGHRVSAKMIYEWST